ncbi:NANOG neighbor homeobox [Trichechus manatus latirostris]|uniref:NANOG neighbor homeobox n=1 Tax=Trichechus manatus latirostris TaxID=127582 RepID=A0A2Y9G490_TRIMA|nr:NANOG neighbor homeobox [Trichechus manatus latirostris]
MGKWLSITNGQHCYLMKIKYNLTLKNVDYELTVKFCCTLILPYRSCFTEKKPMPYNQSPEQSTRNHSENERRLKEKWWEEKEGGEGRGREETKKGEKEKEEKMEKDGLCPKKRILSKSLMDTLWANFKLNKCPGVRAYLSLSFELNLTDKQIKQWFSKKRKKYKKEMFRWKHNIRYKK